MASTYSTNLKIELIGTGDQSGTWGSTTNTNLGTLIEEAIAGYTTQVVADSGSATVLTIPDGATSVGRHAVIEFTGTLSADRTVEVPAVDKTYMFFNNTSGGFSVTVKVSGQTGVTIANGKKAIVYVNSTDVVEVVNAPVTETSSATLTNKTISVDNNTVSGVAASSFVLSNASGNIDGSAAQKAIPAGAVVGTTDSQTLTNKTISVDNNTVGGIAASSFVLSDSSGNIDGSAAQKVVPAGAVVGTTDSQTLTNKTLTDPAIIGTVLEDVFTITDGAAFEIDPGNGSIQLITLGASRTPKATNFAAGEAITLMVDDGAAYTITWTDATFGGSGVVWETDGGSAPTLSTTGYTAIVLWKVGTQVYGARVGRA